MTRELNVTARRKARRLLLQALYQWTVAGTNLPELQVQFHRNQNIQKVDINYFNELLFAIPKQLTEIDALFCPYLDREIAELDTVELTVLRIGSYELAYRLDIPYRVVINEALELNKTFGTVEGYKYVNGVLDKVAQRVRADE